MGTIESYLVIDLPEGWGHLVCECPGHNDHVGLPRGGTEHNAVPEKNSIYMLNVQTHP